MSEPVTLSVTFHGTPPKSGVYVIRNRYDKKMYVGSSKNMRVRWKEHQSALRAGRHHNRYLQNVYNKHGPEAFEWFPVVVCAPEDIRVREQQEMESMTCLYNLRAETAHTSVSVPITDEKRAKLKARAKELWADPAFQEKQRRGFETAGVRPTARMLTVNGVTKPLRQWSDEAGMSYTLLVYRLKTMSPERAVSLPVEPRKKRK